MSSARLQDKRSLDKLTIFLQATNEQFENFRKFHSQQHENIQGKNLQKKCKTCENYKILPREVKNLNKQRDSFSGLENNFVKQRFSPN